MKESRLFEIIYILLNKNTVTAKELSEHFEVSSRTIYRDIEKLCEAGIPIYTSKGKGGGINLLNNFILNKSLLSKKEQSDILSALQGLKATNYPDANKVLLKLTSFFGESNVNWIEVDFTDWSNLHRDKFNSIKDAILSKHVISFEYHNSYGENSLRTVDPLQLWFKDKTWYLKAFCHNKNALRIFKLTRIKNLRTLEDLFTPSLSDELSVFNEKSAPRNFITLKLKIDSSQSYRVYDEFDDEYITKTNEDNFIVTASFPYGQWIFGYLLTFSYHMEVLDPPFIREELKRILSKTLNIYL